MPDLSSAAIADCELITMIGLLAAGDAVAHHAGGREIQLELVAGLAVRNSAAKSVTIF